MKNRVETMTGRIHAAIEAKASIYVVVRLHRRLAMADRSAAATVAATVTAYCADRRTPAVYDGGVLEVLPGGDQRRITDEELIAVHEQMCGH